MSPVLKLVLLSDLAQTKRALTLSVQLVVEIVQQRGSCSPLKSVHTHTHTHKQERIGKMIRDESAERNEGMLRCFGVAVRACVTSSLANLSDL